MIKALKIWGLTSLTSALLWISLFFLIGGYDFRFYLYYSLVIIGGGLLITSHYLLWFTITEKLLNRYSRIGNIVILVITLLVSFITSYLLFLPLLRISYNFILSYLI